MYCNLSNFPTAVPTIAADILIREVIETICKDDRFSIASSEAAAAAKCTNTLLQWILANQRSETYLKFCNDLVKFLMQSFPSASKISKRASKAMGQVI